MAEPTGTILTLNIGIAFYKPDTPVEDSHTSNSHLRWELVYHPLGLDTACCRWLYNGRPDPRLKLPSDYQHAVWSFSFISPHDFKPLNSSPSDNRPRWTLKEHVPSHIRKDPQLVGIIHVGRIRRNFDAFQAFVKEIGAEKNGDNPGGLNVWSAAACIVRILAKIDRIENRRLWQTSRFLRCVNGELSYRRLHGIITDHIKVLEISDRPNKAAAVISLP